MGRRLSHHEEMHEFAMMTFSKLAKVDISGSTLSTNRSFTGGLQFIPGGRSINSRIAWLPLRCSYLSGTNRKSIYTFFL